MTSSTPPPSTPTSPLLKPATTDHHDLTTTCLYCHLRPPIYTCPGCLTRTCSVACVQRHKKYKQCSGARDPAAYVKRSKLMTESGVNRDFNFLVGVEREIGRRAEVEEGRAKGELTTMVGDAETPVGGDEGKGENRRARKRREEFGRLVKERGIRVLWAPWDGFERARENRTWFSKGSKISWTISWLLPSSSSSSSSSQPHRILEHNIPEIKPLIQALRDSTLLPAEWRHHKKVRFYLVLQSPANQRRCTEVEKSETLKQALKYQSVLEFPDILVSMEETLEGWEVVENRMIVELAEEDRVVEAEGRKKTRRGRGKRKVEEVEGVEEKVGKKVELEAVEKGGENAPVSDVGEAAEDAGSKKVELAPEEKGGENAPVAGESVEDAGRKEQELPLIQEVVGCGEQNIPVQTAEESAEVQPISTLGEASAGPTDGDNKVV
ncbi:hypothetical protein EX30DRAFT_14869 [Ascodesmis nigricans]|uniref:HIT-type domain-containing protein n=1 Tax=Ascodesmis nigricans TaxID=341454 RepID=A0A4S2N726_9PEZI|nr:hypothetical protein EX30DRAFT_14869 [Ascodesmis nigricans]